MIQLYIDRIRNKYGLTDELNVGAESMKNKEDDSFSNILKKIEFTILI
jgi:hypothetical protein